MKKLLLSAFVLCFAGTIAAQEVPLWMRYCDVYKRQRKGRADLTSSPPSSHLTMAVLSESDVYKRQVYRRM